MKGFFNKLLRVDMSSRTFRREDLPDTVLRETLGGKGLGVHLLLETPPGTEPFSPENRFIVTVGPLTGTKVWSQSRFAVFSKSPATGGYGESYCGGSLASKIKACGIDALVITGRADSLVFLEVKGDGVLFHDAAGLRGLDTFETEKRILPSPERGPWL